MKRLLYLCVLLSLGQMASAQVHGIKNNRAFVRSTYVKLKNTYRLENHLGYERKWDRHILAGYAIATLRSDHAETDNGKIRFSGAGVEYTYQLPSVFSQLDLTFSSSVSYKLYPTIWTGNYYTDQNVYVPVSSSSLEHFVDVLVGYGVRFWMTPRVYLSHEVRGGAFRSNLSEGRTISSTGDINSAPQHDFRRYGDSGWMLWTALSIGYTF